MTPLLESNNDDVDSIENHFIICSIGQPVPGEYIEALHNSQCCIFM